jgi:FixJ family two-component response regulator
VARGGEAVGVTSGTRARRGSGGTATDRELAVVAAVLATGSEKAAVHRLGLSHSTVKHHLANARTRAAVATTAQLVRILGPRLPEPVSRDGSGGR